MTDSNKEKDKEKNKSSELSEESGKIEEIGFKEISEEEISGDKISEESEEFEGFPEDRDFQIDLSGFSGERSSGIISSEKVSQRNLESELENVHIPSREDGGRERNKDKEMKQDVYSAAQLYNEEIKKYQEEVTAASGNGPIRGLEGESLISPKRAENLITKPTELKPIGEIKEDYINYEAREMRKQKHAVFIPQDKEKEKDIRKYIAKGR